MTGQKMRFIRRFEREAKEKYKQMEKVGLKITCLCNKPKWHLVSFNVDEIKKIIMNDEKKEIEDILTEDCETFDAEKYPKPKYGRTYGTTTN